MYFIPEAAHNLSDLDFTYTQDRSQHNILVAFFFSFRCNCNINKKLQCALQHKITLLPLLYRDKCMTEWCFTGL